MKFYIVRILLLLALPLSFATRGSASSLQGKVVAALDGERITVVSVNSSVKIKLVGVAAPRTNQPYTDIARQHLSDLVLQKYVVVRITTLGHDGYFSGQVMLNNVDVGAQMIRDGVAWYDKSESSSLSEADQGQYDACEQLSRKERRGLWQDKSPTPPWEFREAQVSKPNAVAVPTPRLPAPARRGSQAAFSSDSLTGGVIRPGSMAGKPTFKRISQDGVPDKWLRFQPDGEHFSILAPSDGLEITYPIIDGQAKLIDMHYVLGSSNRIVYVLMWAKGSNDNTTDASVAAETVNGLLEGINRAAKQSGSGIIVTAKALGELKLNGYSGKQYSLNGDVVTGIVRVLSKQIGDQREVFMLGVLNSSEDRVAADRYLNSFRISNK